MRSSLFARPNLKAFVVAAILVLTVPELISSAGSLLSKSARPPRDTTVELTHLLAESDAEPSPEVYFRISQLYEKRGNYRKAIYYFQKGERLDHYADSD